MVSVANRTAAFCWTNFFHQEHQWHDDQRNSGQEPEIIDVSQHERLALNCFVEQSLCLSCRVGKAGNVSDKDVCRARQRRALGVGKGRHVRDQIVLMLLLLARQERLYA